VKVVQIAGSYRRRRGRGGFFFGKMKRLRVYWSVEGPSAGREKGRSRIRPKVRRRAPIGEGIAGGERGKPPPSPRKEKGKYLHPAKKKDHEITFSRERKN